MSTPDQHTAYAAEVGGFDLAVIFHLTTRVFPYWTSEQARGALPAIRKAAEYAADEDWDATVDWLYVGDGTTKPVRVHELFKGLNLWGLENALS